MSLAGVLGAAPTATAAVLVGQQTVFTAIDSTPAGAAEAFRTTAGATGTLTSLTVYVDAGSRANKLVAGIYADKGGTPGVLLGQGTLSTPANGAWNTVPIPAVAVTAGTVYWVALLGPSGAGLLQYRDSDPSGARSETSRATNLTALPATWTTGTAWPSSPAAIYGSSSAATQPVLSVSPSSVVLTAVVGGANPLPAALTVANTGSSTLSFSASSNASWLSVSPLTGSAPPSQTLQASSDISALAAGAYNGLVTISATGAQGSPATVSVTLNVSPPTSPPGSGSDWLTYGHDPQRSGNAAGESVITTANVGTLGLKWATTVDGKVTAQPLFVSAVTVLGKTHDVVVVATASNTLYALDAATGAKLWSRNFGAPSGRGAIPGGLGIPGTPVVDRTSNRVYAVTDDGYLHTVSLADGTEAATALLVVNDNPQTNSVWGGLNLVGNDLYITTGSNGPDENPWWGRVVRVSVAGAAPVISGLFKVTPSIPAPNGGGGIWGYGGASVDPTTGRVFVATAADSKPYSGTVPEGYTLYAGRMVALAANLGYAAGTSPLGAPLGSFEPPHPSPCPGDPGVCDMDFGATPIVFQPTGCPTLVAAPNKDGHLYVLRSDDLAASASSQVQAIALNIAYDGPGAGGLTGVPAFWPAGNTLFVTSGGPGINGIKAGIAALAVSPAPACTLQTTWSVTLAAASDQPPSPPTVANGIVFVGSGIDGSIRAFNAATGVELWNSGAAIAAGATFAPPMVAAGTLYAASWDGFTGAAAGTVRAFEPGYSTPPPPPPPPASPVLGDQTVETAIDDNALGSAEAFQATAAASGTIAKLSVYIDSSSTATTLVAGIYADAAGHPGALIAQGTKSQILAGAWNVIALPGAIVTAGTPYWIAILGTQSGKLGFRDRNGGCVSETSAQSNLTTLPGTWSSGATWPSCPLSAYGSTGP